MTEQEYKTSPERRERYKRALKAQNVQGFRMPHTRDRLKDWSHADSENLKGVNGE